MIVQSPNQIETLYDKAAADIMDNVHQIVFIGSGGQGEKSATKWMSNALGIKTIQAEQTSVHASKTVGMFGLDGSTIEHSYNATQRPLMTQDELYRLPPDKCIVMIKGQKPFLDDKIDLDRCLNFSSDQFSIQGEHGRKLKKELLYPINDKDTKYPAKKRTSDSYRLGLEQSVKIDEEQNERRRQDMKEDEKYDPVPKNPVMPEVKSLTNVCSPENVRYYEPSC